jgi:hypothetical protein
VASLIRRDEMLGLDCNSTDVEYMTLEADKAGGVR